jgi:predicted metalloprotease
VTDRFAIPRDDDVALVNAGHGSWSLRLDFHHHHASSAILDRDKLEAEAQITTRNVSVFLKPRCDTLNGSRWNYEDATARSEHRHANRPARCVNGKTAFRTLPHAQIKFDPSIDLAAA